ncbi:hypothetical protein DAPPUDRAFT_321749 [Daphnia pulex]|uniref:Uncharacterized protein n=1 Tax=Daphnia pulex TaxID=6669 RepID=E9GTS8_DAPPU|nr:hypothetical protein DAPPUDRAFT_321749 [Daphnia pulex]|eukprot:EFX77156.1 hypothetical protein DAPPUDRAFT_321749 [Daphnia pulex]
MNLNSILTDRDFYSVEYWNIASGFLDGALSFGGSAICSLGRAASMGISRLAAITITCEQISAVLKRKQLKHYICVFLVL